MSINTVSETDDRDMSAAPGRQESARQAANILYSSRSNSYNVSNDPSSGYQSQSGRRHASNMERELRFSSVRRMFCLMTVFDFLFMLLLWVIYLNIIGLGIKNGIICQVAKYNFTSSMFDVIALSFVRMGLLLIAYAAFKSRHWAMVAITTAITCALLLSKVFLYKFDGKHSAAGCSYANTAANPLDYIILIGSFTIAWAEVWAIDFKVIPRERKMLAAAHQIAESGHSERAPLLGDQGHYRSPIYGAQQGFYSPIGTPKESDSEHDSDSGDSSTYSESYRSKASFLSLPNSQRGSSVNLAGSVQEQEYIQKAKDSTKIFDKVLATKDNWTVEKENDTVVLDSNKFDGITGKVYRLSGEVDIAPEHLVHILWDDIDNTTQWNNTVLEVKTIQQIDEHIDIIYTLAAPGPGGVVASRDFIIIRNYWERGERHVLSSIGVEHPEKPPANNIVRGFNATGGWVIEPVEGDPTKCRFTWLLHSDLKFKVWTPQTIIDTALCHVLVEMHGNLLKHVHKTFGDSNGDTSTTSTSNGDVVNERGDAGSVQSTSESEFQDAN